MKRLSKPISAIATALLLNQSATAQECEFVDPTPPSALQSATYESKNGWYVPASGTLRILFMFVEINYTNPANDPTLPTNPSSQWQPHQLPAWANQLADPNVPSGAATGALTRYFQLASSGNYNVIGDYLLAPSNGGIFSTNNSSSESAAVAAVNAALGTSIVTANGFTSIADFDNWTMDNGAYGPGLPKLTPSNENPGKYDHVMFIWRNKAGANGTGFAFPWASPGQMLGYQANGYSSFGVTHGNGSFPFNIARHEFSHLIHGGNNFHCGGGGIGGGAGENYFIPLISGWSNMSLYNGSLNSWNAWDRQRLDWKAPGNVYSVSARNAANTAEADGDLDAAVPAGAGTYTLRDFVLTGDAIRIKLPFTDPNNEFPAYLWMENHQGRNVNGVEFDKWQHEVGNTCINPVIPGLYMYQQVDKEVRSGASSSAVYGGYADYLRPITADGFWDREIESSTYFNQCISWGNTFPFKKTRPNPLTGATDQEWVAVDLNNNNVINNNDNAEQYTENVNGTYYDNLFILGHSRHAFTIGGNKKIGMGTNPSSANMMNLVSYNYPPPNGINNLRKVYLNGVSVEILSQPGNEIQVQVRFDDVDINNDVRWCGDEIVLNPISSPSGYSLNLKAGKTITLSQTYTATRMNNPQTINGQKVFASPTLFSVKPNAVMHLEANSNLVLEEGSTLHFETTSMLSMEAGSIVRVKAGCKLILDSKSTVINNGGRIIIEDGGTLEYQEADITLATSNSTLEIAGLLDLKSPVTGAYNIFTFGGLGYIIFNSPQLPTSINVSCTPGDCIFLLKGQTGQLLLRVTQESLRLPVGLAYFIVEGGVCQFAANQRAVRVLGSTTKTTLLSTVFTSTSGNYNTHWGLVLYGGPASVRYSTFLHGYQGIRNLGGDLTVDYSTFQDCGFGIYSDGGSFTITSTLFDQNRGFGISADNMTLPCYLTSSEIKNTTLTNGIGIFFDGSLTSTLKADDNYIHDNKLGIQMKNTLLTGSCNRINDNQTNGIELKQGAYLDFSGNPGVRSNTVKNNAVTLSLAVARDLFLADGYNSLVPSQSGAQNTVRGTIKKPCPNPPVINANYNEWNTTGNFSSSDYYLTTVAGQSGCTVAMPVTINDFYPTPFTPCSSFQPLVSNQSNPLYDCNNCETIYTSSFIGEKINEASLAAMQQTTSAGGNSNTQAVSLFNEMLMYNLPAPDAKEKYILNYSYAEMGAALGAAFKNNELSESDNSPALSSDVQKMTDVLNKQLAEAISNDDVLDRFYYSLDKVNVYRLAGRRDLAFPVLDDMYNLSVPSDELDYLNYKYCITHLEQDLIDGLITPDEYMDASLNCEQQNSGLRVSASQGSSATDENYQDKMSSAAMAKNITLSPNPATDRINIYNATDKILTLVLKDPVGRVVYQSELSASANLDCSEFSRGFYTIQLFDKQSNMIYKGKVLLK